MPAEFITIFVTAPSKKEAKHIVSSLIKKRLVACANSLYGVDSTFVWKGKTEKAKEVLIVFKTKRNLFKKICSEVKQLHSYEVPEIISIPIIEGNKEYLKWIDESVC